MAKNMAQVKERLAHLSKLEKELRDLAKHAKGQGKERRHVGQRALEKIAKKFGAELRLVNHLMDFNFDREDTRSSK